MLFSSFDVAYAVLFTPQLTLGSEYTDNVFLSNDTANSKKEDDLIYSASPGFLLQFRGKNSGSSISYNPTYKHYSDHDDLSVWQHSAGLTGWIGLSRNTTLNIQDMFLRTEDPLSAEVYPMNRTTGSTGFDSTSSGTGFDSSSTGFDSSPGEITTAEDISVRRNKEIYYTNNARIEFAHQFGAQDSISFDYNYGILENEDPAIEDNSNHSPSFDITYWFVPNQWGSEFGVRYTRGIYDGDSDDFDNWRGNIRLIKQFSKNLNGFIEYVHTIMEYDGSTENYQVMNPGIGTTYTFAEDASLLLSMGYFLQEREDSDDESGVIANFNLNKLWTFRKSIINFTASSGYRESNLNTDNFGFTLFYRGECMARYNFFKRLSADITSFYQIDEFINLDPDREDRNFQVVLGLNARLTSWLSSRIDYRHRFLDSSDEANDFSENRVFFRLTIAPSRPYRIFQ